MKTNTLKIYQDENPDSPREWCNLGTLVCWHRNYNLGDEQPNESPQDHTIRLIGEYHDDFESELNTHIDFLRYGMDWSEQSADEEYDKCIEYLFNKHYISLPLYLYDHSGISMSTGSFRCPWDSGQVGFIYVPRTVAETEFRGMTFPYEHLGKTYTFEQWVCRVLEGEVEVYDQYLQGDVYGFVLEDADGEEIDSCWGFYGSDWRTNGMADHIDVDTVAKVQHMQPTMRQCYQVCEEEEL